MVSEHRVEQKMCTGTGQKAKLQDRLQKQTPETEERSQAMMATPTLFMKT